MTRCLPETEQVRLIGAVNQEAGRRHLVYLRDGQQDSIVVFPWPVTALPDQLAYIHFVSLTVQNALKRLPELYFQDFEVRDVLRVTPPEEEWLWQCWGPSQRDSNPVFPNIVLLSAPMANNGDRRDGGTTTGWLTIFKGAPNVDLAKKLALDLLDPANFNQMSKVAGGLFNPAYENLWTDELLAADPNFATIKQQVSVENPFIGPSWPAKPNAAIDAIRAQGVVEQMVANVTSGRMRPAAAVTDAHEKIVSIFEEGGIAQP